GGLSGRVTSPRCYPGSWREGLSGRPLRSRLKMAVHATVAEEDYLQTLFWLFEAGLPMTGANLARAMQLSAPTVHEMVGRLERDGFLARGEDRMITFTGSGREQAERIVRRHRMIDRFLTAGV